MLLPPVIGQEGGGLDLLFWVLPVLVCVMCALQSRGARGPQGARGAQGSMVTESWYTSQDIEAAFEAVVEEAAGWRMEAEETASSMSDSMSSRLVRALGGARDVMRFVVEEELAPRLYIMADVTGPIYFELTEVEGEGTVVKATFGFGIKSKIAEFKAKQPLKIPSIPVGTRCPTCGKPAFPEFSLCPFCGETLLKE